MILNDIGDVSITSSIDNQVLQYLATNDGGYWTNRNLDFTSAN